MSERTRKIAVGFMAVLYFGVFALLPFWLVLLNWLAGEIK